MAPLETAVEEARSVYDPLADKWFSAKNTNKNAKERLDYCNYLVAHPEELNDLASAIKDKETSVVNQEAIIEGAEKEQKKIKQAAATSREYRKIWLVIAAIVAFVLFVAVSSGACSTHGGSSSSSSSSSYSTTTTSGSNNSFPNSSSKKSRLMVEKTTESIDGLGSVSLPKYDYKKAVSDKEDATIYSFESSDFVCNILVVNNENDFGEINREDTLSLYQQIIKELEEGSMITVNGVNPEYGEIHNGIYDHEPYIGSSIDLQTDDFDGCMFIIMTKDKIAAMLFGWPNDFPGEEYAEFAINSFKPSDLNTNS